jgi:mono/diheme cytochrome c family protein/plastocyanin
MNTSKQIRIMVLLVFASLIAAGAYTVWDPHRAADSKVRQSDLTLNRGAYLFAQNCRTCHGDMGEGGSAGNRLSLAPPLNRPDLQGKKNKDAPVVKADKDAAYNLVFNTITCGRVGKAMPTWGDSQGGPLNPEQIKNLALFITDGTNWPTAAEYGHEMSDTNHITLKSDIDASTTTVPVSNATPLSPGTYIKIGDELMNVTAADGSSGNLTVTRPAGNTKAAAHKAGASVLNEPPIVDPSKAAITQPACGQKLPPTAAPVSGTPTAVPTPATNAQTRSVAGVDVTFKETSLTATSTAPITIDFDNQDAGIDHNIHFFKGTDASGPSVAATDVAAGPVKQTLDLGTLAAGTYFYHCDVHPDAMQGTLTVQ